MAEDIVMSWLSRFRDARDPKSHLMVNERQMLIVSEMLGSVDPTSLEPVSPRYQPLDSVSDSQVEAILDGLVEQMGGLMASPGEAVGVIAATSIAEPYTQAILRSFHYAGVASVSAVGPEKALEIAVDHLPNPYHRMCIALKQEDKFIKSKADAVARKISRHRIGDFCDVSLFSPLEEMIEEAEELVSFLNSTELDWDEPERVEVRKRWRAIMAEIVERSDEYYESKQIRLSLKSILRGSGSEIPNGWVLDEIVDGEHERLKPLMGMSGVRKALARAMMTSKEKFKTNKHVPDLYTSVRFDDYGDDLLMKWPRLHSRHLLQLVTILSEIEVCGGCYSGLKVFKTDALPYTRDKHIPVKDDDMDKEKLTMVEKYYEDILYDPTTNPPDEVHENPHLGYGYDVGHPPSGMSRYMFTLQETSHSRACDCGGGWWNVSASSVQLGGAASYEEDWGQHKNIGKSERTLQMQHEWGPMTSLNHEVAEGLDPTDPGNWFFPDYQAQQRVSFPYSRPGAHSDIPMSYMHSGRLPLSPNFGEWYVIAAYADPQLFKDYKWNESIVEGAPPAGHFINAMKLQECDQVRTTTDDVQQTFHVLGIEAARIVLIQNLYNTLSGGELMAGADYPVSLSHYMLMADAMCEGPNIRGAPAGRGSRVGVASTKGGGNAVLAIAYEQEVSVVLDAAVRGLRDPLLSPKSAQIVGVRMQVGSGWAENGGRFAETISLELPNLRRSIQIAAESLQLYAVGEHGVYWYDTDEEDGVSDLSQLRTNSPLFLALNEKREVLMADGQFVEMFKQWSALVGEYQSMLEEHFDAAGIPIKAGEAPKY